MINRSVNLTPCACRKSRIDRERGVSLIMVMLILVVVSILGIGGAQISIMSERVARNDRDQQIAFQAAEAALLDAAFDIYVYGASTRKAKFDPTTVNANDFVPGCGASGDTRGLCSQSLTGKPAWLTVDFLATGSGAPTTEFGTFTGRTFSSGGAGIQPVRAPRYVIEMLSDVGGDGNRNLGAGASTPAFVYRVTAMGFGPREDIRAVLQMVYRN